MAQQLLTNLAKFKAKLDMAKDTENTYGFGGHLSWEFPSQIIIDVTELCNLECIHCPHPEFKASKYSDNRNLSLECHDKIIDEVARDGQGYCQYLRYTGQGETLLNKKLIPMIRYAAEHSNVPLNSL